MTTLETLVKIGFTEKEIKVYMALLKHGRTTPATLAKLCKISRPTVYNIARGLLTKGVIAEDLGGKTLYFTPLPPTSLQQIIDRPQRELDEKKELVKKVINDLSMISSEKEYPVPKIRFIEENKLENFLYENTEKWNKALLNADGVWWGFQDHSLVEHYEDWIFWFWKQKSYQVDKIKTRLLSNVSTIEEKMGRKLHRTKRDIRFLGGMNFTSSVWVVGDYLIMTMTQQHPFYLVEIHDATLAHNMREVFKKLWSLTEVSK